LSVRGPWAQHPFTHNLRTSTMSPITKSASFPQSLVGSEAKSGDGLFHILLYCYHWLVFRAKSFLGFLSQRICELIQGIRSLGLHICVRCGGTSFVPIGCWCQRLPNGYLVPCKHTHARTADIREIFADRGASLVDLQIFLEGWDRGEKWASQEDSRDSCSL
jgi:hypothetical protein